MAYDIYDFQDRIDKLNKLIDEIFLLKNELDKKIDAIEKETNDLLDQEYLKKQNDNRDKYEMQIRYLDELVAQGREVSKDALGLINYFEQAYGAKFSPQNIDFISNVNFSTPYQYIDYMRTLYNNISSEVMKLTDSLGQGFLGKMFHTYNVEVVENIFREYEKIQQIANVLHSKFEIFYSQIIADENKSFEIIKAEADRRVEELVNEADNKLVQFEEMFDNELTNSLSDEYITNVERRYNSPGKFDFCLGTYCFYIGDIPKKSKIYHNIMQRFSENIQKDYLCVKVTFDLLEQHSFVFNITNKKVDAIYMCQNMILAQLKKIEASLYKITVCSGKGSIEGLENLKTICKYFPMIANGVLVQREEIKKSIILHLELMNDILQNKLVGFGSIDEFNKNSKQKIPYRTLLIVDYEFDYLENEIKLLIEEGYRAGIQVLLIVNELSNGLKENEKFSEKRISGKYIFNQINYYWRNESIPQLDFEPDFETIDFLTVYNNFARDYFEVMEKNVDFKEIVEFDKKYCKSSREKLSIPIGINENGSIQCIEMGDSVANGTSHYGIIVGPTGSGKSSLLHTIITSTILNYSPDEVELYLLDFKQGNEFKIYESKRIPHIKCLGLDAMQEFGESVLQVLWRELERRNRLFAEASKGETDIKDIISYRNQGFKLPRIFVIMDEFQVLFDTTRNKNIAYKAAAYMSDFVSRARVYGIHFLLATQTLHKIYESSSLSKGTLEEMHIRIGLQCPENELIRLMGEDNTKNCIKKVEKKKGFGIYLENDIVSEPLTMQVAYLDSQIQKKILSEIESDFTDAQIDYYDEKYVFRGEDSPILNEGLLEKFEAQNIGFVIGEPIGIGSPISIKIAKKRKSDILIIGENQNVIDNMGQLWIKQVLRTINNLDSKRLYVFDGAMMIDEDSIIDKKLYNNNRTRIELVDNVFSVLKAIDELYFEYSNRRQRIMKGIKMSSDSEIIYVLISNYQWIEPLVRIMEHQDISEFEEMNAHSFSINSMDELKNGDDENPFALVNSMMDELSGELSKISTTSRAIEPTGNVSYYKKLKNMLTSGYFCGLHFVFTCQDISLMKKLGQSELGAFHNRVLFRTTSKDSYSVIDSSICTENLADNIAIYSDGINEPQMFRPYEWK